MGKKQIAVFFALRILFIALLLLGCAMVKRKTVPPTTAVESPKVVPPRETSITKDVRVFKDLHEIDLDGDGVEEIIAIYSTDKGLTGVKVIKIGNDKVENIIFKKSFITPDIKFELKKGIPTIIVKEKEYLFGLGLNKIYVWDGKTFVRKGK